VAETECPREPGVRAEFAGAEQAFCRPSALKILKYNNIPGIFGLAGKKSFIRTVPSPMDTGSKPGIFHGFPKFLEENIKIL